MGPPIRALFDFALPEFNHHLVKEGKSWEEGHQTTLACSRIVLLAVVTGVQCQYIKIWPLPALSYGFEGLR